MFAWRYLDGNGDPLGESRSFADQALAEAWMAEAWGGLQEQGVEEVELVAVDSGLTVYRMTLAEETA